MTAIHVITASAGTGKTTRLVGLLEEAIASGAARPEAVVATTFTNQAAAELAERARSKLLAANHVEAAHRLLAARIGTVNSVCGRLVEDFAFELGLPPGLRVLDVPLADAVLRDALATVVAAESLAELQALAVAMPQLDWMTQVRRVIEAARVNGIAPTALPASAAHSLTSLRARLPPPAADGAALDRALEAALIDYLARVDLDGDVTSGTQKYTTNAQRLLTRLQRGALTWPEWATLASDRPTSESRAYAAPVNAAAAAHVRHPALHRALARAIELVFAIAQAGLVAFRDSKRGLGAIDFIDQEVYALEALAMPEVQASLAGEIDLLLVDEFQDTSPLQLAIFLRLAALAKRAVWVGDQKQAIFGFRGTDPRLMDSAIDDVYTGAGGTDPDLVGAAVTDALKRGTPETLDRSWRSRKALVELTSDLFAPAFERHGIPSARTRLVAGEPKEPAGLGPIVERWCLDVPDRRRTSDLPHSVAAGIQALLAKPPSVRVRGTRETRAARPGDIAVLCLTNSQSQGIAQALKCLDIDAVVPRLGLCATLEGRVALAALRLWIDPRDSLAAAELARVVTHADQPVTWLAEVLATPVVEQPLTRAIREAHDGAPGLGVLAAFDAALATIELPGLCRGWGDAADRLANLDRLRAHAVAYVTARTAEHAPPTLAGLNSYFGMLETEDRFRGIAPADRQAVRGGDDVVTVSTWHAAKGLEWPITILFGLEGSREPIVTGVHVGTTSDAFDAADPLRGRWIRYWPDPYHNHKAEVRTRLEGGPEFAELRAKAEREALRLLYVGWTRARDYLVLAAMEDNLTKGILARLAGADGPLLIEPPELGPVVWAGRALVVPRRMLVPVAGVDRHRVSGLAYPARAAVDHPPARVNPSSLAAVTSTVGAPVRIGPRVALHGAPDMTALGQAVHGFLAADAPGEDRAALAAGLLHRWGVAGAIAVDDLLAAADRLGAWIAGRWPGARALVELPVRHRLVGGTVLVGTADLVIEHAGGRAVIDHKTFPGSEAAALERAARHAGQLAAYAGALAAASGVAAVGAFLHLPMLGLILPLTMASSGDAA